MRLCYDFLVECKRCTNAQIQNVVAAVMVMAMASKKSGFPPFSFLFSNNIALKTQSAIDEAHRGFGTLRVSAVLSTLSEYTR